MAMLAEPRRKQKIINLRAKNNAWSNDNTKFGQRMLEKMGWSSGKGLGANENGITEHIIARYKNDDKGLGFEDKNDQWTKHEDDFNALLANLSNASDKSQENLHSGTSLEDKSKKSKARIHYHKFTRGKDISRYSEKDLANIFGKKSFKNIEVVQEPINEDIKTTEQVFTEKGSMEDYFKNKLSAFKSKNKCNNLNVIENNSDQEEPNYNFCGFSQETDDKLCAGLGYDKEDKSNNISFSINNTVSSSEKLKKKKKSSKSNNFNTQHAEHVNQSQDCTEGIVKKKKKSKNNIEYSDNIGEAKSYEHLNGHEISTHNVDQDDNILKKKRKSKKKDNAFSENVEITTIVTIDEQEQSEINPNKKKKKEQSHNLGQCEENVIVLDEVIKKKKSKRKNEEIVDVTLHHNIDNNIPKKKKKKSKENT